MQHGRLAVMIVLLGVLTGCGSSGQDDPSVATTGPDAFCERLAALNRAGPAEAGGNNAALLSELLVVAEPDIADAVETFRDYHRDVYVEGDDTTDTYDQVPGDVREAVDRIDAYAEQHC